MTAEVFSIKGHFNGTAVVLDEPAALAVGQAVRVVLDSAAASTPLPAAGTGAWKGKFRILEDSDDIILDHFSEYLPWGCCWILKSCSGP